MERDEKMYVCILYDHRTLYSAWFHEPEDPTVKYGTESDRVEERSQRRGSRATRVGKAEAWLLRVGGDSTSNDYTGLSSAPLFSPTRTFKGDASVFRITYTHQPYARCNVSHCHTRTK